MSGAEDDGLAARAGQVALNLFRGYLTYLGIFAPSIVF